MKTNPHFFPYHGSPGHRLAGTGAALLAAFLLWQPGADAAVQISNLGKPVLTELGIHNAVAAPMDPHSYSLAMSFTTGDTPYMLEQISITTALYTLSENQDFLFSIYATDISSLPTGAALVSLDHPDLSVLPTYTNTPFTPSVPFQLAANTTYSLVIEPPLTGSNLAAFQVTTTGSGYTTMQPGWSFDTALFRVDNGAWSSLGDARLMMEVDAIMVPEPSTWALLGASLGGIFLLKRRPRAGVC